MPLTNQIARPLNSHSAPHMSENRMRLLSFRDFVLYPDQRRLTKNEKDIDLTTRAFNLLLLLIENAGRTVTKEELLEKVWGGQFVEECNVAVHVSRLRAVLEADGEERVIKTVHGSGYCFTAGVETLEAELAPRPGTAFGGEPSGSKSIAILPVANETGDPEMQYLAEALTDSLTNSVSRLRGLRVVPRTSAVRFAGSDDNLSSVADELDVTHLVTARLRRSGESVSMHFEILDAVRNSQLFGDVLRHDSSDLVVLQESMTARVAEAVATELDLTTTLTPFRSTTRNPESHRLFLKGTYLFGQRTAEQVRKAIACFEASITADPSNVAAYVSLIESYRLLFGSDQLSFDETRRAIDPLIRLVTELDPGGDLVLTMLGGVKMYFDWDFESAEESLRRAVALNPTNLESRYRYVDVLLTRKRFAEALRELNKLRSLDPASPGTLKRMGKAFYRMSQFPSAQSCLEEALEMNPGDFEALAVSAAIDIEMENFDQALIKLERSLATESNVDVESMRGYLLARMGEREDAERWVRDFTEREGDRYPVKVARVYAAMENTDQVFAFLDQAWEQREIDLIGLYSDPRWQSLAKDLRFDELAGRIGLVTAG